jgi:hypothetical protein
VATAAVAAVVLLVGASCSDPEPITAPPSLPPGPEVPEPAGFVNFVPPDYRGIVLAPVPEGKPQRVPPIEVYGGEASLRGRLTYNGEAVGGATVTIERFVGLNSSTVQVGTAADGGFAANAIRGGRYRVRAFLGDELTLPEAATVFLAEKQGLDLPLAMTEVPRSTETIVTARTDPAEPPVGREVTLRFTVTNQTVAPDGTVESEAPATSRQLEVTEYPGWSFAGGRTGVTNDQGVVSFKATCKEDGTHQATVELGWIVQDVDLPSCGETNGPPTDDIAVGDELVVPTEGPVPAGTYVADRGGCATTYESWDGGWSGARKRANGRTLTLGAIARDLRAATGTAACTYERTK